MTLDPRFVLSIVSGAAGCFAFIRLALAGVLREYVWFAGFIASGTLQTLLWLAGTPSTPAYAFWWGITMPLVFAFRVAAVVEAWRHLMHCYPGVETVARRLALGTVLVGIAISLVDGTDGLRLVSVSHRILISRTLFISLRYSHSTLLVVCGILWAWAALFRSNVPDNLVRHLAMLTGYFAFNTAGYLLINIRPGSSPWVGAVTTGTSAAFYVLWGLVLSESGNVAREGVFDTAAMMQILKRWEHRF